jgi:hypothetical protein
MGVQGAVAEKEEEEEEDESELLRRALESDEIDAETLKRILDAADKNVDVATLDLPGVKRLLLNLEKKISTNQLRVIDHTDHPCTYYIQRDSR